ncbi:YqiA/YcfP family alpha/beta fold hydrolase [Prevotella sp. E2-28]|uniref:YqiA/YcfP family alpha/beta fold hydrolase n=1 Tax=Prevotella sp. E2-28 TaxID=2913620 RepID=UPI001EDBE193|nr:YqiA/YcfP family alpha/beta fold hydrolase [Prevotella sp. E2-28]UKK53936.1 esterase [Prevotella sp. E2-28]
MEQQNQYVKQFPDLMKGKTVMYLHGFGSSGQSGTVTRLRTILPNSKVIAPDLPIHPIEAQDLLRELCEKEKTDLILGTSMGGMYTEQLYGFDRICMNPALCLADTMQQHGMTGTQTFQNPRLDGIQQFYVDKALVKEYRQVSELRFSGLEGLSNEERIKEENRVYGLFGDKDNLVDTFDMFREHYPLATHFHGEHRMDDRSFMHAVVPVIRWIDDKQEHRQRPIIYIGIETLADTYNKPNSSCQKAIRLLIENYQVFFVCEDDYPTENHWGQWLEEYINVPAWQHTIYTPRRDLLYGDYLISKKKEGDTMATLLEFGSDTFKTWEDIIEYFSRLGGQ